MSIMIASTPVPSALSIMRWRSPGTNIQERKRRLGWSFIFSLLSLVRVPPHPPRQNLLAKAQNRARRPLPQGETGLYLIRLRHAEHVLAQEGQHQIVVDGRRHIKPRFAEFPLHVVFPSKTVAAMRIQTCVGSFPSCLRRQQLRHIGFGAALLAG